MPGALAALALALVGSIALVAAGEAQLAWVLVLGIALGVAAIAGTAILQRDHATPAPAKAPEQEQLQLAEQLISAEQDERRRLSILLHDGPLQSLSGIALMHDVALGALENGEQDEAVSVMRRALDKERDTLQTLRDLSFAIEPLVLRDQGFVSAVKALADQIERRKEIRVTLDCAIGEELAEKAQVALYQTIREALTQAARRKPRDIRIDVSREPDGSYLTVVEDDGMVERRRRNVEAIEERARLLRGTVSLTSGAEAGNTVRVSLPSYVARASSIAPRAAEPAAA